MPRLSAETRILILKNEGYSVHSIKERLLEEQIYISQTAIYNLLKKYRKYHVYTDLPRAAAPKVLNDEQVKFIDNEMAKNDELTVRQIQALLLTKWPQLVVSLTTIKKTKKQLGWVVGRPKYCQLVRVANKQKRVDWCRDRLAEHETFDNVIFTDECTI